MISKLNTFPIFAFSQSCLNISATAARVIFPTKLLPIHFNGELGRDVTLRIKSHAILSTMESTFDHNRSNNTTHAWRRSKKFHCWAATAIISTLRCSVSLFISAWLSTEKWVREEGVGRGANTCSNRGVKAFLAFLLAAVLPRLTAIHPWTQWKKVKLQQQLRGGWQQMGKKGHSWKYGLTLTCNGVG